MFEVFNGLMKRSDHARAIKIPLAIIPGGSGKRSFSFIGMFGTEKDKFVSSEFCFGQVGSTEYLADCATLEVLRLDKDSVSAIRHWTISYNCSWNDGGLKLLPLVT